MPPEAADFMEAVAAGGPDGIALDQARDLVTAFMRLGTWTPRSSTTTSAKTDKDAATKTASASAPKPKEPAGSQDDLFPDDRP